jgi:hypothetical protein
MKKNFLFGFVRLFIILFVFSVSSVVFARGSRGRKH